MLNTSDLLVELWQTVWWWAAASQMGLVRPSLH